MWRQVTARDRSEIRMIDPVDGVESLLNPTPPAFPAPPARPRADRQRISIMKAEQYIQFDALGLAELVAHRDVTPQELADVARQQHERLTPRINSVLQWIDPQVPEHKNGDFFGVPFL